MEDQETTSPKKPLSSLVVALLIILVIGGIAIFLLDTKKVSNKNANDEHMTQASPAPSEVMKPSPAASNEGAMSPLEKKFTVHATNYAFDTKTMTANKGDKVTVTFINDEGFHDWVLDEFNAKTKTVPAGQTDTVSFVADKTGKFEYYCSVGDHRMKGMVGELTVQ